MRRRVVGEIRLRELVVGEPGGDLLPALHPRPRGRLGQRPEMPRRAVGGIRGERARRERGHDVRPAAGEPVRVRQRDDRARIVRFALHDHLVYRTRDLVHFAVRFDRGDEVGRRRAGRDPLEALEESRHVATLVIFVNHRVEPRANAVFFRRGIFRDHCEIYRVRAGGAGNAPGRVRPIWVSP